MHIIILGALLGLVAIIAIFFVKRIIEVILTFPLYIVVIGLSSAAIISYIISKLFELEFWIVFPITLIISIFVISIIIDRYQPEKTETKKTSNGVTKDKLIDLSTSTQNTASSLIQDVKSSVDIKSIKMENFKKMEDNDNMGLLNSAKNVVSSATEKVKDSVNDNVKDKVQEVTKTVTSSVSDSVKDTVKKGVAVFSNRKEIDRMNAIRFNSAHLTDEQLIDYVKNKSIELYEKMGYAAAFADRYPPEK